MYVQEGSKTFKMTNITINTHDNDAKVTKIVRVQFYFLFFYFSIRLLSVLRGHSLFHPRHNGQ